MKFSRCVNYIEFIDQDLIWYSCTHFIGFWGIGFFSSSQQIIGSVIFFFYSYFTDDER